MVDARIEIYLEATSQTENTKGNIQNPSSVSLYC